MLFLAQYRYDNKYRFPGRYGVEGVLDLSAPLDGQPLSMLTYGWELYPQELLNPGEFSGHRPLYIYLGQYGGFESGNPAKNPHGCATYRLNILLPSVPEEYALELPEIYSASRVWVNGRLVSSLGDVAGELSDSLIFGRSADRTADRTASRAADRAADRTATRTGMITFQAAGSAELVVQAADSRHYYSGMVYPPAFGTVEAVSDLLSFRLIRTCVMVIASLTIGILYLLIGCRTWGQGMRMILFALVSLSFFLYVMYPLFHLFGAGYWSYRLEDMSFYLFLAALAALHCDLCGITGRGRRIAVTVSSAAALLSLAVPALLLRSSLGNNLDALLIYSAFVDGYKLLLFGWLITTALPNRNQRESMSVLLLSGLCVIAVALFAQESAPVFEPVRFGWQTETAGFILILLLAGGLWFDTVSVYSERAAMAENIRLMRRQFSLQEENYRMLANHFEEIRRMRHDLRHHLNTIKEFVKQQQYKDLENYVTGYEESTEQADRPALCDNRAASAVLTYYRQLARQKEIPLTLAVSLPPVLKLEDWNLGVLFGNLIENAIEASEKLPPDRRSVKVYSKLAKGNLLITVKNNWNGDFSAAGEQIDSTKHEGAGIGIASVRDLVKKNGGQFYLTPGEEEFAVSIVLWGQG